MDKRRKRGAASRDRVIASAARRLRERGLSDLPIGPIMREAGLTHGGFYLHFRSKRDLLGEALRRALGAARGEWLGGLDGVRGADWLRHAVERYLDPACLTDPALASPFTTLAGEAARGSQDLREAFERELREAADRLAQALRDAGEPGAADRALATLSLCAGALLLARAVNDPALATRILAVARRAAVPAGSAAVAARPAPRATKPRLRWQDLGR